jgi:hypothetical protein
MKPPIMPFTALYTQWLDSFRVLLPGREPAAPAGELTPKAAQSAADQEWEEEGGCITPAQKAPGRAPAPKIPF